MGKWVLFLFVVIAYTFTSCYSDYLHLDYKVLDIAKIDSANNTIPFTANAKAFRKAKGIAAFPDGGQSNYLLDECNLYLLNRETKTLTKLVSIYKIDNNLRSVPFNTQIVFSDSMVYFQVIPYVKFLKKDSSNFEMLPQAFCISIENKAIIEIDTVLFKQIYQSKTVENCLELSCLRNKLAKIHLKEWGFVLQDLYPKSEKSYIEDFVYTGKGGNGLTKRAIAEQIIANKSKDEIRAIITEMDDYKKSLTGLEKDEYELYAEDAYLLLEEMLEQ
jgi:hypothetical protein